MRKLLFFALVMTVLSLTSCERVQPNYAGVLMEHFGKDGKSDFSIQTGWVNVMALGSSLYQVPLFEQRAEFESQEKMKAKDNTEFTIQPQYTYKVIKDRAIDVVFDNKHLGYGDDFMRSLEDMILEPRIRDLAFEESRRFMTDSLMADGGNLAFEKRVEDIVRAEFERRGLELGAFVCRLDFDKVVKDKISDRNEVNTNLSVLDQKILAQEKEIELEKLKTEQALIRSKGLTKEILYQQFIEKWDGHTPIYGAIPDLIKVQN